MKKCAWCQKNGANEGSSFCSKKCEQENRNFVMAYKLQQNEKPKSKCKYDQCGTSFETDNPNKKYCSAKCRERAFDVKLGIKHPKKEIVRKPCKYCEKKHPERSLYEGKYCNKKCKENDESRIENRSKVRCRKVETPVDMYSDEDYKGLSDIEKQMLEKYENINKNNGNKIAGLDV